jgi:hypothetical protein
VVNGQTGWFPANFAEEVPWTPGESAAIQGSTDESYANDTSGDEDLTVADRLAVVESTSARLVHAHSKPFFFISIAITGLSIYLSIYLSKPQDAVSGVTRWRRC